MDPVRKWGPGAVAAANIAGRNAPKVPQRTEWCYLAFCSSRATRSSGKPRAASPT
jgi:hypothetical protein